MQRFPSSDNRCNYTSVTLPFILCKQDPSSSSSSTGPRVSLLARPKERTARPGHRLLYCRRRFTTGRGHRREERKKERKCLLVGREKRTQGKFVGKAKSKQPQTERQICSSEVFLFFVLLCGRSLFHPALRFFFHPAVRPPVRHREDSLTHSLTAAARHVMSYIYFPPMKTHNTQSL